MFELAEASTHFCLEFFIFNIMIGSDADRPTHFVHVQSSEIVFSWIATVLPGQSFARECAIRCLRGGGNEDARNAIDERRSAQT